MGLYRGGRKKGTKNKRTDLFRKCDEVGLDVFTRMLEIAIKYQDEPTKQWPKLIVLAQYLYAKPKDESDISDFSPEEIREYIMRAVDEQKSGS
jgi:hypothetical protein